jgi:hypothetical protein
MKYAFARDMPGEHAKWTLTPWRQRGLREFDRLIDVPDDHVVISSHFAPWWSPLREYIAEGRPWIEIEYGYWGPDTPRRETRRVTWCGHHNMHMRPVPYSRTDLFLNPAHRPWQQRTGSYVLAIQPVEEILIQRTGENMQQFRDRLTAEIRKSWCGDIIWRKKVGGAKPTRWPSYVEQLQQAHAVVGERTMACVEAVLLGVPAYTTDASMTTLLMGSLVDLGNPKFPDRSTWWQHICWSQFARSEFDTSAPCDLVEQYQIQSQPVV